LNNRVLGVILAIAGIGLLIVGAFAFIELFRRSFTDVQITQPTPVPVVKAQVVVTTSDLFKGELLETSDVNVIEVPAEFVPRDAISSAEDVIDKFIKVDLVQGEMILKHNLADPTNVQHDLSFALSDDHVLVAFPATDDISVQSIIQKGDIVDIFASLHLMVEQAAEEVPEGTIIIQGGGEEAGLGPSTLTTFNALQKVTITGMVMDIIVPETAEEDEDPPPMDDVTAPPGHKDINIRIYLLALDPQDALVLKWLKDSEAIFDIALRAPTSTGQFDLTPITEQYITELYGLEILP
jgi:Flp pilus assembly protein CpaB